MIKEKRLHLYFLISFMALMSLADPGSILYMVVGIGSLVIIFFTVYDRAKHRARLTIGWTTRARRDREDFDWTDPPNHPGMAEKITDKYSTSLNRLAIRNEGDKNTTSKGKYHVIAKINGGHRSTQFDTEKSSDIPENKLYPERGWPVIPATYHPKYHQFYQNCTEIYWRVFYTSENFFKSTHCSCREFKKRGFGWVTDSELMDNKWWELRSKCRKCPFLEQWKSTKAFKPDTNYSNV